MENGDDVNELHEEEEEDDQEQEGINEYYASLVSGPYSHIFLENFRKEIQKSSTKKKVNYNNIKKKKEEGGTIETEPPPMHEPPPKPLPADNLKSSLKSSTSVGRKKKGISMKKKVTWAPDVYDPPPLSESHYIPASSNCGSSSTTTSGTDEYWHRSQKENQMKGKKWQQGVVDKDAGESVEKNCFKNVNKKCGKKNGTKVGGGKGGTERGVEMHESESNKSQKNQQRGGRGKVESKGGKEKDMKQGGRAGEKGAKDKDKKLGKSKEAKEPRFNVVTSLQDNIALHHGANI